MEKIEMCAAEWWEGERPRKKKESKKNKTKNARKPKRNDLPEQQQHSAV